MRNIMKYNIQIYDCAKKINSSRHSNSNYFLKDLSYKLNTPVSNLKNINSDNDNTFDKIRLIDSISKKKYNSKLNSIKKSNRLMKSIKNLPHQHTKTQNFIRSIKLINTDSKIRKYINDNNRHHILRNINKKRKNSSSTVNNTINYISITNNNTIAFSERKDNLNYSKRKGDHNIININSPVTCIKKYENIFDKFFEYLSYSIDKNKFIEIKKKFIQILFEEFNLKTDFYSNKTEEEILTCSIKNFIKHNYNFYSNYSNCSTRNKLSFPSTEFNDKHNQNNYTNIENFNDTANTTFLDSNNCTKSNLYKTISGTNRKIDIKNNVLMNFVHKTTEKKTIRHNPNNVKIDQKYLFQNHFPNKPFLRTKPLINSKKKKLGNLTFNNKFNLKHNKKKTNDLSKHNISNDITFKKEEPNHLQENISKLESGDTYTNSEETNAALLVKIKHGLDDNLKKMFNFSYENFLNKDSENDSRRSYLDM